MGDKIISVLFLAFIVLIPLAIIVLLVIRLITRITSGGRFMKIASRNGWTYHNSKDLLSGSVRDVLESTLFPLRPGKYNLQFGLSGTVSGTGFSILQLHYSSPAATGRTRTGGVSTVLQIPNKRSLPPFQLRYRLTGSLSSKMEDLFLKDFKPIEKATWEWASATDPQALLSSNWDGSRLQESLRPGDMIFVFSKWIILSSPEPWPDEIEKFISDKLTILKN